MLTDEERMELHRQLQELQREEERRVTLDLRDRAAALSRRRHESEETYAPLRMR